MQEIEFQLRNDRQEILIDGIPLLDLVRAAELPYAREEQLERAEEFAPEPAPLLAGEYSYFLGRWTGWPTRHYLGEPVEVTYDQENDRKAEGIAVHESHFGMASPAGMPREVSHAVTWVGCLSEPARTPRQAMRLIALPPWSGRTEDRRVSVSVDMAGPQTGRQGLCRPGDAGASRVALAAAHAANPAMTRPQTMSATTWVCRHQTMANAPGTM